MQTITTLAEKFFVSLIPILEQVWWLNLSAWYMSDRWPRICHLRYNCKLKLKGHGWAIIFVIVASPFIRHLGCLEYHDSMNVFYSMFLILNIHDLKNLFHDQHYKACGGISSKERSVTWRNWRENWFYLKKWWNFFILQFSPRLPREHLQIWA